MDTNSVMIGVTYHLSGREAVELRMSYENVMSLREEKEPMILLGDFNMPNIDWQNVDDYIIIVRDESTNHQESLINMLYDMGLHQINHIKNENGRILDLVWTTNYNLTRINQPLQNLCERFKATIHHKPLSVQYYLNSSV